MKDRGGSGASTTPVRQDDVPAGRTAAADEKRTKRAVPRLKATESNSSVRSCRCGTGRARHDDVECDNNGNTYSDDAVFPDDWIEYQKEAF